MKRIALLLFASCSSLFAGAQASLSLSGSSYTQNFNSLASGLPAGWHVFTSAGASTLGVIQDTSSKLTLATGGSINLWRSTTGGFKNFASANANPSTFWAPFGLDSLQQSTATNRALGIRQVANTSTAFPGSDSGAAFALLINNTTGLSAFNMSFKLQSLDSSSPRQTLWLVDYGIGLVPTSFTPVPLFGTGSLSTGGSTFSNQTLTVAFGSALNNQSGPVWIRIWAARPSTGSGTRPSSAIDDVSLNWTGTAVANPKPNLVSMAPTNNATGVAVSSNLTMLFDKKVTKGTGNIYLKNRTTQTTNTIAASSANVTITGGYLVTVSGLSLAPATTYHVTFDSTAFDSSGFRSYGIYDTTAWKFTTVSTGSVSSIKNAALPVSVISPAANGAFIISCSIPQAAILTARVYDLAGREVAVKSFNAAKGDNRLPLHTTLAAGTYIIRVDDGKEWGSVKAVMQ